MRYREKVRLAHQILRYVLTHPGTNAGPESLARRLRVPRVTVFEAMQLIAQALHRLASV